MNTIEQTLRSRPIPFSAPMVRAILDGTKTQTRRIVKDHPGDAWVHDGFGRITSKHPRQGRFGLFVRRGLGTDFPECDIVPCPYGQPGDGLWVREHWRAPASCDHLPPRSICDSEPLQFIADETTGAEAGFGKARRAFHMPRWASRITLEIVSVRVERLQAISEADALAEGVAGEQEAAEAGLSWHDKPRRAFRFLWQSINGADSWDANPWVWVVEFKRVEPGRAAA